MGEILLETSKERVDLLKAGIKGKEIEELYIVLNDLKILDLPVLSDNIEVMGWKRYNAGQGVTVEI